MDDETKRAYPSYSYDMDADAAYFYLREPVGALVQRELSLGAIVDWDSEGVAVGVEFLAASKPPWGLAELTRHASLSDADLEFIAFVLVAASRTPTGDNDG